MNKMNDQKRSASREILSELGNTLGMGGTLILVTGGGGFVGFHLVNQLVEAGEAVRGFGEARSGCTPSPLDAIQLAVEIFGTRRKSEMQCVIAVKFIILQRIPTCGPASEAISMR
jgi:nucleoside-diphosphate-sugar epimerase